VHGLRRQSAATRGVLLYDDQFALRAINVGGRNMVSMSDLRSLFEAHGFDDVRSLLQTGNLVFRGGTKTGAALERLLESEAERRLHVSTTFIVRTSREWDATIESNPFPKEAVSDPGHLVVLFLKDAPNAPAVEALRSANKGPEIIDVVENNSRVYSEGMAAQAHEQAVKQTRDPGHRPQLEHSSEDRRNGEDTASLTE
jgi:uncharacterized protein (DUF1697 family)